MFRALVAVPPTKMLLHTVAGGGAPLCAGDNVPLLDGTAAVVEIDVDGAHVEGDCEQRVGEKVARTLGRMSEANGSI